MFWNDPNLYTATLPYKELAQLQTPFLGHMVPWQNVPRFIPQYGFMPQARLPFNPMMQQWGVDVPFNPMIQQIGAELPYYRVPQYGMIPQIHNFQRPFFC